MNAILIAGPTASGKSALALELARKADGVVINADSMQVYDVLRLLTARPSREEMDGVPHVLYGHVGAVQNYSVGAWCGDVRAILSAPSMDGRTAIFVGGTGLYFKALTGGLSAMPDIPEALRLYWREALRQRGAEALHGELKSRDPKSAALLNVNDSQRIVRALEVFEASGQSISDFQGKGGKALIDVASAQKIVLTPDRAKLKVRINQRFEKMMETGAVEEVRGLLALGLSPDLPAMKAIGVREISALLTGSMTRAQAVERASIATRQYAKRQMTWFRNQLDDTWVRTDPDFR
tara:strand:+ start:29801 stop:30682 length:882 start_codon:yes stop_codon:yes gene_type:complete